MSRSGYSDDWDVDNWAMIRYRGAVMSAVRGKYGQAFLRELIKALDALPEPKLVAGDLQREDGSVCALGAVGKARSLDMSELDPEDIESVADQFGIADALAKEIVYMNDEQHYSSAYHRFERMRRWAIANLKKDL